MAKQKKYGENEYKVTRIIVSVCFIALIVFYILYFMLGGKSLALMSTIIIFLIGVLLCVFCYTIWKQKRKVSLEYDDLVVCKLCGACGVLCVLISIIILFTQVIFK